MEASKNIRNNRPIVTYALGGFVSVTYIHNRPTTHDIDFILAPTANHDKILEKLRAAISRVANRHNLAEDWMNNSAEGYAYQHLKNDLFGRAVNQNVVLFSGRNLIIYAAPWDWALARKLQILSSLPRPGQKDLSDAVAYLYRLNRQRGTLLTKAEARNFNQYTLSPISETAITNLGQAYRDTYRTPGLCGN